MIKTLDEIQKEYEEQLKIKEELNALSLPTGKNNMYTLTYISFFEKNDLTLLQKGILIHLYIRGGHIRVVKHSINKIAKTLGIAVGTMSSNIKKLESLNYLKTFKKVQIEKNTKTSDLIYLYPIDDLTGVPIKSNKEEIDANIKYMIDLINNASNNLYKAEVKNAKSEDETIEDLEMDSDIKKALIEKLDRNIHTPAHLAFMENPLLSINDKVIYLYLKLRSGDNNSIFEEKKKIAAKLNISTTTLNNSLIKLFELNYIVKFKRFHSVTGNKSSDLIYINYYNNFTGLPEINDTLMKLKIDECKKKNFSEYNLTLAKNFISKKNMNEIFTKQIKNLIELDDDITDVYYDTFVTNITFELNNDIITIIIPKYLNTLKEQIISKLTPIIKKYANAILKNDNEFYINIKSNDLKSNI